MAIVCSAEACVPVPLSNFDHGGKHSLFSIGTVGWICRGNTASTQAQYSHNSCLVEVLLEVSRLDTSWHLADRLDLECVVAFPLCSWCRSIQGWEGSHLVEGNLEGNHSGTVAALGMTLRVVAPTPAAAAPLQTQPGLCWQ